MARSHGRQPRCHEHGRCAGHLFYTSRQSLHTGYHSAASDRPLTPEEHAAAARHAERVLLAVILVVVALVIAVSMIR